MRTLLHLLLFLLPFLSTAQTHIEYNFDKDTKASFTTSDVTASFFSSTGLNPVKNTQAYSTTGHSKRADRDKYSFFTIAPNPGYTLRLTMLALDLKIKRAGTDNEDIVFDVRYGEQGAYGKSVQKITIESITGQNDYQITTLLTLPEREFGGITGPVSFHFFCTTGAADTVSLDNISLTGQIPLPIELAAFSGKADTKNITLKWATAMEKNASSFEVQRSTDAAVYTKVGTVAATGNSTIRKEYSFKEPALQPLTYYRLKLIDKDLTYKYSKTIAVKTLEANLIKISNPSSATLHIYAGYKDVALQILDATGKNLRQYKLKSGQNQINTDLGNGVYVARYTWGHLVLKSGLLLIQP